MKQSRAGNEMNGLVNATLQRDIEMIDLEAFNSAMTIQDNQSQSKERNARKEFQRLFDRDRLNCFTCAHCNAQFREKRHLVSHIQLHIHKHEVETVGHSGASTSSREMNEDMDTSHQG